MASILISCSSVISSVGIRLITPIFRGRMNPAFGQMFKMNAKTDTEGNVNSILVTIYDSLEQMYGDLCLDLELHSKSGFLKYKKDKSDVLMNFI